MMLFTEIDRWWEEPAIRRKVRARREEAFRDGRIIVYVDFDGLGGYYHLKPDPRKKQYRKPKLQIRGRSYGCSDTELIRFMVHPSLPEPRAWYLKTAEMLDELFAWVAQAEEHRSRKPKRVFSTNTPGSILA
jgi:hypothetical protein